MLTNDIPELTPPLFAHLTSLDVTLDMDGLDATRRIVVLRVTIYQTGRTIEIQLVRPTEVCGKV